MDRQQLILENLDLVRPVAIRMMRALPRTFSVLLSREELVSAGHLGLVQAASAFDESHGVPFRLFAGQVIEKAINRHISDTDARGRRSRQAYAAAQRVREENPTISIEELAGKLGRKRLKTLKINLEAGAAVTLSFTESPQVEAPSRIDEVLERQDAERSLECAIGSLRHKDQRLIRAIFYDEKPMREVAQEWGVNPSVVTRTLQRVLRELRQNAGLRSSIIREAA